MTDVETGIEVSQPVVINENPNLTTLASLDDLDGATIGDKVDNLIKKHAVFIISRSWCPFCRDVKDFLTKQMSVPVVSIEINEMPEGDEVFKFASDKYAQKTVPFVFLRGDFVGGCDDTKKLHAQDELEKKLRGLVTRQVTKDTERLETARLIPVERSKAMMPLFWFPNTVNNHVVRATGLLVFCLSVLSCAFHFEIWGRYLAVFLLVDFSIRLTVGSFLSPLSMLATLFTVRLEPNFKPGPPKQFAALCGTMFSLLGTIFYFVDFPGHEYIGAAFMGGLAFASGLEGFMDFCLGCMFYGYGIQFGLIPDYVYRIYTATREEIVQSWKYMYEDSNAPVPTPVDTDPSSDIALKYKKKTDEWTKDDFHLVRNMQVSYFAMPLAITGLAVAFKVASAWLNEYLFPFNVRTLPRTIVPGETFYHVIGAIGSAIFLLMCGAYAARLIRYPHKCWLEWDDPLRSPGFGLISITMMLYSFILYNEIDGPAGTDLKDPAPHAVGRVALWIGTIMHSFLTVAKIGEFIGRRLESEQVHAQWIILPVGLSVCSLVGNVVGWWGRGNDNVEENVVLARFFQGFAVFMWLALFTITFFKYLTTHNSDNRIRHGAFIWVAAPGMLALSEFTTCSSSGIDAVVCVSNFEQYYFIGLWMCLILFYAALPHLAFFGREPFSMAYWTECFAADVIAACAALHYGLFGYKSSQTICMMTLSIASIFNLAAFLHSITLMIRQRSIFTPEVKWGPLSFMKLTHEAFRGNLETLKHYCEVVDVEDETAVGKENLGLFAAHFNRFCVLHEEHSKHEDQVIFKTFNDYFPEHAKKYNDDHAEDHKKLEKWRGLANKLLDCKVTTAERKAALDELRADLPAFFTHFQAHLKGEEENLNPIGRKYLPLAIMKEISREVWKITPAEKWEIILPFIIHNLPRHMQRIRYLKVLMWSMPERAQQFGSILYRNVDAVMWERLRAELPEIVPRAAPGYKRYY